MPRALTIAIAALLAAPAALLAQATLSGTLQVQRGQDRFPLADCVVFGTSAAAGALVAEYSDEKGLFELTFPPDPQISVGADCAGYRLVSIDGRRSPMIRFDCSQHGPCGEVALVVEPLGVVEGYVLDPRGQPVEGAVLGLSGLADNRPGRPQQARSDDRGYFRLYHLPPGEYELAAISDGRPGNEIQWRAKPQRIEVGVGDTLSGFEVRFQPVEGVPFSGRIKGLPEGTRLVLLHYSSGLGRAQTSNATMVRVDEEGRFQVDSLPQGQYDFAISIPSPGGAYKPPEHVGSVDLTSETGEVVLGSNEPIELTGTLEVQWPERDDLPYPLRGRPIYVRLQREDGFRAGAQALPPEHRFQINDLRPGRYQLEVIGPGAKVERRVGEDAWGPLDEIILAEGDKVELDLRVRFELGRLTVVVRPEGARYVVGIRGDDRTMLMPTDQNGRLSLNYFPSGAYKICAWPDISREEADDPATWERAGDAVREFRHDEGADMEITLTAVSKD